MPYCHNVKILIITLCDSGPPKACTILVQALGGPESHNVKINIFTLWRYGIVKPFWERNNLPKYFKKDYNHLWITHFTFEKITKNQNFVIFPYV